MSTIPLMCFIEAVGAPPGFILSLSFPCFLISFSHSNPTAVTHVYFLWMTSYMRLPKKSLRFILLFS